jgi:hypothetical protein
LWRVLAESEVRGEFNFWVSSAKCPEKSKTPQKNLQMNWVVRKK